IGAILSVLIPLIGRAGGGGRWALVVAGLPVARVWAVLAADRPARQLGMPTLPEHAAHERTSSMAASEAMPARVPMSLHSLPEVGMPRLRKLVRMVSTSAWLATRGPTAGVSPRG